MTPLYIFTITASSSRNHTDQLTKVPMIPAAATNVNPLVFVWVTATVEPSHGCLNGPVKSTILVSSLLPSFSSYQCETEILQVDNLERAITKIIAWLVNECLIF